MNRSQPTGGGLSPSLPSSCVSAHGCRRTQLHPPVPAPSSLGTPRSRATTPGSISIANLVVAPTSREPGAGTSRGARGSRPLLHRPGQSTLGFRLQVKDALR